LIFRTLEKALQKMDEIRQTNSDKIAYNIDSRSILPVANENVHPKIDLILNQVFPLKCLQKKSCLILTFAHAGHCWRQNGTSWIQQWKVSQGKAEVFLVDWRSWW